MFGLFKFKITHRDAAVSVYRAAMEHALTPRFYEEFGVPDTFTGRFDCLLLHIFLVMERMIEGGERSFNQSLFDITFANMDQTLREMGIGDVGVPKHQKKMMKAFNGRMHAYRAAMNGGDMKDVLRKNLYGGDDNISDSQVAGMEKAVQESLKTLRGQSVDDILAGNVKF